MSRFGEVGTFRAAASQMIAGVTDILLRLVDGVVQVFTTTRPGGGLLSLALTDTGPGLVLVDQQGIAAGGSLPAPAMLSLVTLNGQERLVWTGGSQPQPGGWAVNSAGELGAGFALSRGPAGVMTAQIFIERDGIAYTVFAPKGTDRLEVWQVVAKDRMALTGEADLPGFGEAGVDVSAMASLRLGGQDLILTLSTAEEALRVWELGADGSLVPVAQTGAGAGLGLSTPSALELVRMAGQTFALVAGAGSSSLSVVRIGAGGQMTLADHVIDTLNTRFQRVQAMTTVELSGQVFVFAGGADDGVQAFQMLPDGRLVLAGQITRRAGLALDNITAMEAVAVDGRIELVLGGEGAGLIRLTYDPGPIAAPRIGTALGDDLAGDARADLLAGGAGCDTLSGGAGEDILSDGAGIDVLWGGAGADLFVLSGDGAADTIRDFTPGEDRIDLSDWGRVYSISVIDKAGTSDCVVLRWGQEVLTIYAAAGQSLGPADFTSSDLFGLWHLTNPVAIAGHRITGTTAAETLMGGGGADTLVASAGPDLLIGGSGADTADYGMWLQGVVADLALGSAQVAANLAAQDRFESVENLSGSAFDDRLGGNEEANLLLGRAGDDVLAGRSGNDRLAGGDGNDTLLGGSGADWLRGDAGIDCASWVWSAAAVDIDLTRASQSGGEAEGDRLDAIEGLIGSSHADRLTGDDGANLLFGQSGNDRLAGGRGNDALFGGYGGDTLDGGKGDSTLDGGAGNDWLVIGRSNDILAGGAGIDWAVAAGKWAARLDLAIAGSQETAGYGLDRMSGIENLRGGPGADSLLGNGGGNRLRGDAGGDWLSGRGGADTLNGGEGDDRLEGGAGFDWAIFDGGPVIVNLRLRGAQTTGAGVDRLTGIEALAGGGAGDRLHGDAQANALWGGGGHDRLGGGGGADSLRGGAGRDWLAGGAGDDVLNGGSGADRFQFGGGADRITDFSRAQGDRLVLEDDSLRAVRGLSVAQIIQRFGHDLGNHVQLDFGAAGSVDLAGIATLGDLRGLVEVI